MDTHSARWATESIGAGLQTQNTCVQVPFSIPGCRSRYGGSGILKGAQDEKRVNHEAKLGAMSDERLWDGRPLLACSSTDHTGQSMPELL